jgi:hypothetical protein
MLRQLFSVYNPLFYLLLLGLVVILLAPGFSPLLVGHTESLAWAAGQRLSQSLEIAPQPWSFPWALAWVYRGLTSLFGENDMRVAQIIRCLWVYVCACIVNSLFNRFRFREEPTIVPGLLYTVLMALMWPYMSWSSSLLVQLPLLGCLWFVHDRDPDAPNSWLGQIRLGAGVAVVGLLDPLSLPILLAIVVSQTQARGGVVQNFVSLVGGAGAILVPAGFLYWVDFGGERNLGQLELPYAFPEMPQNTDGLLMLVTYSGAIVISLLGVASFHRRAFGRTMKSRKAESSIRRYTIGALVSLGIGLAIGTLDGALYVVFPLCIYSAFGLIAMKGNKGRAWAISIFFSGALLSSLQFYLWSQLELRLWLAARRVPIALTQTRVLDPIQIPLQVIPRLKGEVWVLGGSAAVYLHHRLLPAANVFTNQDVVGNLCGSQLGPQASLLEGVGTRRSYRQNEHELDRRRISIENQYQSWVSKPPDAIWVAWPAHDCLRDVFPLLVNHYSRENHPGGVLYRRRQER